MKMPEMVERKCQCCKTPFMARAADVKRGWARFCSKSCKAVKQEARTGQYAQYKYGRHTPAYLSEDDDTHPFSEDALGQG